MGECIVSHAACGTLTGVVFGPCSCSVSQLARYINIIRFTIFNSQLNGGTVQVVG